MLFSHGPNKPFLVLDSCRETTRNDNSLSANFIWGHHWKKIITTLVSAIFRQFDTLFWTFWHCRKNKDSLVYLLLKLVHIYFMFSDNERILYIYLPFLFKYRSRSCRHEKFSLKFFRRHVGVFVDSEFCLFSEINI